MSPCRWDHIFTWLPRVWRVVSEDSFHFVPAIPMSVHLLAQLQDTAQVLLAPLWLAQQAHSFGKFGIAGCLAPYERKPLEEREHDVVDLRESIDLEVPPAVSRFAYRPAAKNPLEQLQWGLVALRDIEGPGAFPSP